MSDETAPCPFCGSPAQAEEVDDVWWRVSCTYCGAGGPVCGSEDTPMKDNRQKAIAAWNAAPRDNQP